MYNGRANRSSNVIYVTMWLKMITMCDENAKLEFKIILLVFVIDHAV